MGLRVYSNKTAHFGEVKKKTKMNALTQILKIPVTGKFV